MNAFGHMVHSLTCPDPEPAPLISHEQYQQWRKQQIFDVLQNVRFGQSFCNHFNITDAALFYNRSVTNAEQYILKHYVSGIINKEAT